MILGKAKKNKPLILVISLGGTIVSKSIDPTEPFYDKNTAEIKNIIDSIPDVKKVANIESETLLNLSSHNITYDHLILLVKRIEILVKNPLIDGIVVTQGTNTLEEVSYFVSLVIKTTKVIVFTGSIRSTNSLGYDGGRNLYNAVVIASSEEAKGKGVLVTFNDRIVSAKNASKLNSNVINDFSGNDMSLLGHVLGRKVCFYNIPIYSSLLKNKLSINKIRNFSRIFIFYVSLDVEDIILETAIEKNADGIIIAGMGSGYFPSKLKSSIEKASKKDILMVRCSRTGQSIVYHDPETDDKYGLIPAGLLSPQKARILLHLSLNKSKDEIKDIFSEHSFT